MHGSVQRVLSLFLLLVGTVPAAVTNPAAVTAADIQAACLNLPAHPRLHVRGPDGLAALRTARSEEAIYLRNRVIATADGCLTQAPAASVRVGRRLEGQDAASRCIIVCAAAYAFTDDVRYAARARDEMLSMCAWEDWVPDHYLGVAEILRGLAFGYDWTYAALTAAERKTVRDAIISRGYGGMSASDWWRKTENNWGQVCWQGVTAAAIAIYEDDAAESRALLLEAIPALARTTKVYSPKGAYPEGPGYWEYGTGRFVFALDQFECAFGTTFGLGDQPGVLQTPEYLLATIGPTGRRFNYSDCADNPTSYNVPLLFFARAAARPDWIRRERAALRAAVRGQSASFPGVNALWTLLWCTFPLADAADATPLDYFGEGENAIATLRENRAAHGICLGVKGGSASCNHGHMDVGSFVLDMDGVRWGVDLGSQNYNSIEQLGTIDLWGMSQNSTRWDVFRLGALSHNVVTLDSGRQQVAARVPVESVRTGDVSEVRMDLTPVFGASAVSAAERSFTLDRPARRVTVADTLKGVMPDAAIRWSMVTPTGRTWIDGQTVHLVAQGAALDLTMTAEPAGAWELRDLATPSNPWDVSNAGYSQLIYVTRAPSSGGVTLSARFATALRWPAGSTFYGLKQGRSALDAETKYGSLQAAIAWWNGPRTNTAAQTGVPTPWSAAGYGSCRYTILSANKVTASGSFPDLPFSFGSPTQTMEPVRFGGNIVVTIPDATFYGGRMDSNSAGLTTLDGTFAFVRTATSQQFYASGITNDTRGFLLPGRIVGAADVDLRFGATFCTGEHRPARHRLAGDFSAFRGSVTTLTPAYRAGNFPEDQYLLLDLESPTAFGDPFFARMDAVTLAHGTRLRIADTVVQSASRGIALATKPEQEAALWADAADTWTLRAPVTAATGSLVKKGAGRVTFAGMVDVPAVRIDAGTACIAGARLTGTLQVAADGRVEIPSGLRVCVPALELDGTAQPVDVYGGPLSDAPVKSPLLGGTGVLVVGGEDPSWTDCSAQTGYVLLESAGSGPKESPLNVATNVDVTASAKYGRPVYFWSDHLPVHAGTNYYVNAGFRTYEPVSGAAATCTFPGERLVAGPNASFNWKSFSPVCCDFAQEGVVLNGGAVWRINASVRRPVWVKGRMTLVNSGSDRPFVIRPYGNESTYSDGLGFRLDTTVVGDADQCVLVEDFTHAGLTANWPVCHSGTVVFGGDLTGFHGMVAVSSNRVTAATDFPNVSAVDLRNCGELETASADGATVAVRRVVSDATSAVGCAPTNVLRIGSLALLGGGTLRVHWEPLSTRVGCVTVEDMFMADGPIAVTVDGFSANDPLTVGMPRSAVFKVASRAGTFTREQIVAGRPSTLAMPVPPLSLEAGLPHAVFDVAAEDGYTVLYASYQPVVRQVASIPSYGYADDFNKGGTWSNGKTPAENAGLDFVSALGIYIPGTGADVPYRFPGASFTLDGSSLTFATRGTYVFPLLDVFGGSTLRAWTGTGSTVTVDAPIGFHPKKGGPISFLLGRGCGIELKGPLHGAVDCVVAIRKPDADTVEPSTVFRPSALNTGFTGRWTVRHNAASLANPTQYMQFVVADARNLGGPRAAFAYNALEIRDWQSLTVAAGTSCLALSDPTRGLSLVGNACLDVPEGATLAVTSPVTWSGHVRKRGAGMFALGGTASARFGGAEQRAVPSPGTNVLEIAGGAFRPLSTNAVDGLALVFAPGTCLRLDAATADAALRTFGFRSVQTAEPLARTAGFPGPVPVDFGWSEIPPPTASAFAVCTVAQSASAAASRFFAVRNPFACRRVCTRERLNTDGSVTLLVSLKPVGCSLLIR